MGEFSVDNFMENMGLIAKHPEIFQSGRDNLTNKFISYFEKYTKEMNSTKPANINSIIQQIKSDFNVSSNTYDKLQIETWSEKFFKYCADSEHNEVYVFPPNIGNEKIRINQQYYINCMKMEDIKPETLILVNRNNHMMLAAEGKNPSAELGQCLNFKVLFIRNAKLNKWIVVPFKLVSLPKGNVRCDAFSLAATTDDINRQYDIWMRGIQQHGPRLGVLNIKFLDKQFMDLPNLFGDRSKNLMDSAYKILKDINPTFNPNVLKSAQKNRTQEKKSKTKKVKSVKKKSKTKKVKSVKKKSKPKKVKSVKKKK